MDQKTRWENIYASVRDMKAVRLSDLARSFNVSMPTIRKDVDALERDGLVERVHGLVRLKTLSYMFDGTGMSHLQPTAAKVWIGAKAATLVGNGDSMILDCGATTTEMAKNLVGRQHLRIVTNALNIAMLLGNEPSNRVMLTGGQFMPETLAVSGEKASAFFEGMFVDKLFLAAGGVSKEGGISYPDFIDLHVKSGMIGAARHVYLLADSQKFGRREFATFGAMDRVHTVVTDRGLAPEYAKWLDGMGVEVIYADAPSP